jgi:Ni,Fe-hydrogenase III large subunit
MQILNYHIQTSMGKVTPYKDTLDFLTKEQSEELDVIGYTGKSSNGVKMCRVEFLNSLDSKEQFGLKQIKFDKGDFIEEFIVTRVIILQKNK